MSNASQALSVTNKTIAHLLFLACLGCTGDSTTAVVEPTSLVIAPAAVILSPGGTERFVATGRRDGNESPITVPVAFTATGGTISADGNFTAGSTEGEFLAIATALGGALQDTARITVSGGAASDVALRVSRLESGSGAALVSNGIPLVPGALRPEDINKVRIFLDGTEQPIFIEALTGLHRDGSLRSILVQFQTTVDFGTPREALLRFGAVRSTADRARVAPPSSPVAVALPSSAEYLVRTELIRNIAPVQFPASAPAVLGNILQAYTAAADAQWTNYGTSPTRSASLYEHIHSTFAQWIRTADVKWWDRANQMALAYIAARPTGTSQEWYTITAWAPIHYWTTGRPETRAHMVTVAGGASLHWGRWDHIPFDGNDRIVARYLGAMIDGWKMGIASNEVTFWNRAGGTWSTEMAFRLNMALEVETANGKRGGTQYCGEQKNFMSGLAMTTLIRYYEEYEADSRIIDAVKRQIDWQFANSWSATLKGFTYVSGSGAGWPPVAGGTCTASDGGGEIEPPLNGLIAPAYLWIYYRTGDATYRTRYLALMEGVWQSSENWGKTPTWAVRNFDQAYWFTLASLGFWASAQP